MERERASDRPRRRDSKYTTNGWKEYRQYDSYQPSSFNARDKPPVQSIRRPTQSEYWDQRPSPVGNTSRDGISSSRSQRGSSATKGKERRLSSVPLGVGVVESEPSLATSGSRSSTRERSERHRLEADGKRRGLGSEDAVSEADNINARSQRRKSESSKLRVQTATNDIIKHNDTNGYVAPASASPRHTRGEDRGTAANSLCENSIPQGAPTELETFDKDTILSGEQTPSGQTPTTFAIPALPTSANIDSETASAGNNQKLLVKNLYDFSQSVTELASVTIRRDTAKATMKKKEKEYERWRSQHGDYTSLAEEQEKEVDKLKETIQRLDEKLKKVGQTRDEALNVMARTILSASNGITISEDSPDNAKIKSLETEIKEIKAQLVAFKISTGSLKDYESRLKANEASVDQMDREMPNNHLSLKSQVGTIRLDLFQLSTQANQNKSRIISLENNIGRSEISQAANGKTSTLAEEIRDLRRQIEPLHTLRRDFDEIDARIGTLSSSVQALSNRDSDAHQAVQYPDQETRIAELQNQSLNMKTELDFQVKRIAAQESRIISLASVDQAKVSQVIESPLPIVGERLAEVARELAQLKKDQESKDDLVAKEVERVDQSIAAMQNSLSEMHTKVNLVTELAESQNHDSLTSSKPVDPVVNGVNALPPRTNGLGPNGHDPVTKAQESHPGQAELLADYNGRLIVCETVLKSLQHRFDNLNTADLARNMAHQMANMYPYPANVLGQLDQISRNYSLLAPALSHLETTVAAIIRRLEKTPGSMPQSPAAVSSPAVPPGRTENSEKTIISFGTQLGALSKEVTENSQELKDISSSIDVAKRQYQNTVEALKSEIATLKETMNSETAAIRDIATKRVGEESDNLEKVFADVKPLVDIQIETINNKFKEKEEEIMHELASLNGKIEFVKIRFEFADQELRRAGILHDKSGADGMHDRHASAEKTASPTISVVTRRDGESEFEEEEDDDVLRQPSLGKSILSKRKREIQRRRKDSSDSDSDFQPRRKVRTAD